MPLLRSASGNSPPLALVAGIPQNVRLWKLSTSGSVGSTLVAGMWHRPASHSKLYLSPSTRSPPPSLHSPKIDPVLKSLLQPFPKDFSNQSAITGQIQTCKNCMNIYVHLPAYPHLSTIFKDRFHSEAESSCSQRSGPALTATTNHLFSNRLIRTIQNWIILKRDELYCK